MVAYHKCFILTRICLGLEVILQQISRFLKKHNMTNPVITRKAQNIRFHEHVTKDWVIYVNRQIAACKYEDACIISVDKMNIDFDPSPSKTLCKIGDRTVSACVTHTTTLCTPFNQRLGWTLQCTRSGYLQFPMHGSSNSNKKCSTFCRISSLFI
jgi:hypothetical protein